ncbi:hypothetical protein [Sulfurovum sp. NBC37-1]|uniref:hypothetical protein n=1 Tax=Sulfurovum sp. (strain NBC37-1) TaxID=387093 RepID=UPI00015876E2|nr:hypothetical protein [Sulfurovum sp. NBC37-1]BAF71906.1 hypothetical protein SUN_0948 [Sulfurovum sp. NBC37-1]
MIASLPYKKILKNAAAAFFIYGTWAYGANDTGAVTSAFTQGSMSFAITVILAMYLEIIHRIAGNFIQLTGYVLAWFAFIVGTQAAVHYTVGTEHIFLTLLPGMIIGSIYVVGYLYHLKEGVKDETGF